MNKLLFFTLFIIAITRATAQPPSTSTIKFDIKGTITGVDTGLAWITYENFHVNPQTFTSKIKDGKFEFTGTTAEPCLAQLNIRGLLHNADIYLDEGSYTVMVNKTDPNHFQVKGSKQNEVFAQLKQGMFNWLNMRIYYDSISAKAKSNKDASAQAIGDKGADGTNRKWTENLKNSVKSEPKNYVVLNFLFQMVENPTFVDEANEIFYMLDSSVRKGHAGDIFKFQLERSLKLSVGRQFPHFEARDLNGKKISTEVAKGHVTVIDFWASFCEPCRAQAPAMAKLYKTYHEKGLEIISVSADTDSLKWKQAVKEDNMEWYNLSDLKGMRPNSIGRFYASAIPAAFVIDANGTIVGRDLNSSDLYLKVEEQFKNK